MNFYMKQEEKSPRESGGPVRREGEPAIVASPRVSRAARRSVLGRNNIITQSHDARRGEGRSLRTRRSHKHTNRQHRNRNTQTHVTAIVLYPPGSVAATNPPIRLGGDAPTLSC